ncbi:dynein axonemal intermediate chain 3-like [Phymastichus coffea]|uniref:dynein axonemal intermediate chain 3-like n=1 Tax=Phymastichus coffea TaxID=108790 RepID=UPI00273CD07D|nr:dynein axonemal intermediate chain 3-like [Phymastichus coffea]
MQIERRALVTRPRKRWIDGRATVMTRERPRFGRSPLAVESDDIVAVKLAADAQRRLGCVVNEHVFLECPYAFVPRDELLDVARGSGSPLNAIADRIKARSAPELLVGYASDEIEPRESGDFVICLTEESTRALVSHNRTITKSILKLVQEAIRKSPRPWTDLGSTVQCEDNFLNTSRSLFKIDLHLPISELCRPRSLTDCGPDDTRDGCVELTPLYETFDNVEFTTISQACQTNLGNADAEAQTYPGNPKHQWTQYELEIPNEFTAIWKGRDEKRQEEDKEKKDRESSSENKDEEDTEVEKTEEEIAREEKRRHEWEKLSEFLKTHVDRMIDTISFNASTNLYRNDVANLASKNWLPMFVDPCSNYENRATLIDLKAIGNRYLFSMSWHCELDDILACVYLDQRATRESLIAVWSLETPLQPKMVLKCEEKVSIIAFCPSADYTNVIVGGCLDGTIVLWDINRQILTSNIHLQELPIEEAKITGSSRKSQKLTITSIQWLPFWCRIASDGNFQKISVDSPRDKRSCFATSSTDGTIFFWSLPKSLSTLATARSPLDMNISPIYQLILEKLDDKVPTRVSITSFLLPLAKNEESSSLSIRDQTDLERLRKVFVGTFTGEILYCGWESQTFAVDSSNKEVCKIIQRCNVHDGIVRCMVKASHLDDVFLTVGGRVFAIWKEDFPQAPIFHSRSKDERYGEGCWSGRSGMFILTRLDGRFEVWDLKRKADQPIRLQTVSEKVTPYICSSPLCYRQKLLSVLDGVSTVRVFVEPDECVIDEDLERVEWFEEFAWRETKRKLDFHRWQDEYLSKNPVALRRKQEREQVEINKRHQEARERFLKEQEAQARAEEESKLAKRRVSKTVILRRNERSRAEAILLQKKGFVPAELEEKRKPLVDLEDLRRVQAQKISEDLNRADELLKKSLARKIPEMKIVEDENEAESVARFVPKSKQDYEQEFKAVKEELTKKIKEQSYFPSFDWKTAMRTGAERMQNAKRRELQDRYLQKYAKIQ